MPANFCFRVSNFGVPSKIPSRSNNSSAIQARIIVCSQRSKPLLDRHRSPRSLVSLAVTSPSMRIWCRHILFALFSRGTLRAHFLAVVTHVTARLRAALHAVSRKKTVTLNQSLGRRRALLFQTPALSSRAQGAEAQRPRRSARRSEPRMLGNEKFVRRITITWRSDFVGGCMASVILSEVFWVYISEIWMVLRGNWLERSVDWNGFVIGLTMRTRDCICDDSFVRRFDFPWSSLLLPPENYPVVIKFIGNSEVP